MCALDKAFRAYGAVDAGSGAEKLVSDSRVLS